MKELTWNGDFWETEVEIPLFPSKTKIFINREDEKYPSKRQLGLLDSLKKLSINLNEGIAQKALVYLSEVESNRDLTADGITISKNQIANHYKIKNILIPELFDCEINYFFLSFECDWDEEHGMEVLIGNNEVLYCGMSKGLAFNPFWEDIVESPVQEHQKLISELVQD